MAYIPNSPQNTGLFLATTNVWNAQNINTIDVKGSNFGKDFQGLTVDLYQNINNIVVALNKKDTATYDVNTILTGAQWFNPNPNKISQPRWEYRKVVNFGALGVATKSVAHGIDWGNGATTTLQVVDIWAVATKKTTAFSALPIPYASSVDVAHNIELFMDATNVTISNGIDRSAWDTCTVTIEFLLY